MAGREVVLTVDLLAPTTFEAGAEGLMVGLVTAADLGLREVVGGVTPDRIFDADAAVGFVKSVVSLRFGFSTGGGGGWFLERAREAAVGVYK